MKRDSSGSNGKLRATPQENDQRKALGLCEWLVIGLALGFVLTALAVALFIHSVVT